MRIVSHEEYLTRVEPVLRNIFVEDDPFGPSFAPNIHVSRCDYDLLDRPTQGKKPKGLLYDPV